MIAEFLTELDLRHVTLVCNDWGGAQLLISPGGTDRVANLVLVSCEAFDNYPPGVPGRPLCRNAALPGGTFLTAQLSLRSVFLFADLDISISLHETQPGPEQDFLTLILGESPVGGGCDPFLDWPECLSPDLSARCGPVGRPKGPKPTDRACEKAAASSDLNGDLGAIVT